MKRPRSLPFCASSSSVGAKRWPIWRCSWPPCRPAGTARGSSRHEQPQRLPSETHKPITGYLWGAPAVLTCPCHLPILAIVLAGTTAGAFIGEYWGIAALTLTGLFVLSVTRLLRAFKDRS